VGSLISFGPLEGVINAVVAQTNQLASSLAALEERSAHFLTTDDGRKQEHKIMDLGKQHHALVKRFDENFLAIEHLADDVPKRLAVHEEKLRQAQEIHSLELEKTRNELMARLKLAETEIDQRALMSEFWKLTREVEDRTRIADTNNLRDIVINVRDETIARVDDMCDRSFAQRKELDEKMSLIEKSSGNLLRTLENKLMKLDAQSTEVSTFMHKSERALAAKVSNEQLQDVKQLLLDGVRDIHTRISAQTTQLKSRVDSAESEIGKILADLAAKGTQSSFDELMGLSHHLRLSVDEIKEDLATRASESDVLPRLSGLEATVLEHTSAIASKADADITNDRHELHVADTATHMQQLTSRSDELHACFASLHAAFEAYGGAEANARRAIELETALAPARNALEEVTALRSDLGGRVATIEEWLENHPSSKANKARMKLQKRQEAKGAEYVSKEGAATPRREAVEIHEEGSLTNAETEVELARLRSTVVSQQASLDVLREEVHALRSMLAKVLSNGHVGGPVTGAGVANNADLGPSGGTLATSSATKVGETGAPAKRRDPGADAGSGQVMSQDSRASTEKSGTKGRASPELQPWADSSSPRTQDRSDSLPTRAHQSVQGSLQEEPRPDGNRLPASISGPTYVPGPMLPAQQAQNAMVQSALRAAQATAAAAASGQAASGMSASAGAGGMQGASSMQTASPQVVHPQPNSNKGADGLSGPSPSWMGSHCGERHLSTAELRRIDMSGNVNIPVGANDGQRFPELAARAPALHVPKGADPYYEHHRPPQMRTRSGGADMRPTPPAADPNGARSTSSSPRVGRAASPSRPHPVFKTENEKRAWALKEKRKSVIEDRLGPQPWSNSDARGQHDDTHDILPPIHTAAG